MHNRHGGFMHRGGFRQAHRRAKVIGRNLWRIHPFCRDLCRNNVCCRSRWRTSVFCKNRWRRNVFCRSRWLKGPSISRWLLAQGADLCPTTPENCLRFRRLVSHCVTCIFIIRHKCSDLPLWFGLPRWSMACGCAHITCKWSGRSCGCNRWDVIGGWRMRIAHTACRRGW